LSFRTVSFREDTSSRAPAPGDARHPRIRVLVNGLHSKTGGGLTYLRNVLPLLERQPGVEVHLCIHESQEALLPKGLKRTHVHLFGFRQGFWRLLWEEQVVIPRLARLLGADVTFSPANMGPMLAPNGVVLLRNAPGVVRIERRMHKWGYWILLYLATFLSVVTARRAIAVSEYAKRALAFGPLRRKVTVVHHGIAKVFGPPAADVRGTDTVLAVSDIYIQKNFDRLIEAFARLREERRDLRLVIAGQPIDADYFADLQAQVRALGVEDAVEFTGRVDLDVLVDLYRRCAVFVFPSTVETFGNPLVEAMASGAPIASSDAAAMPEVVGDAAILFDPDSVDAITAAAKRLLDDRALCDDLSAKAVERAKAFSWEKTVAGTAAVLREAAGKPSGDVSP
jgi:glycosyltransferase involved in cell wall biosynthesis